MALPKNFCVLLLGLLSVAPAIAGNFYCCQDPVSGRRVCGDVLPEQCKGRPYRLIDGTGSLIREVGPPITAEQRALQEAELKRKVELENLQREQRRRDAALLESFNSLQDIDNARIRAEEEVASGMRQAEKRIIDAQTRRKAFLLEAEFYKNRTLPPEVAKGLSDTENEISAQKGLVASKQQDLESVRARFAENKRRYLEITAGGGRYLHPAMGNTPLNRPPTN